MSLRPARIVPWVACLGLLAASAEATTDSTRFVAATAVGTSAQTHDQTLAVALDTARPSGGDVTAWTVGLEARRRTFASGVSEMDALMMAQVGATLAVDGPSPTTLSLGGSLGSGAAVAPRAQLWLDCAATPTSALTVGGRLWFQHFRDTDVVVLAPSVAARFAPWTLSLADYMALHDRGAVTHSGLARLVRTVGAEWTVEAGGGMGNGADYVGSPRVDLGRHALGLVGARLQWSDATSARASYTLRREHVGAVTLVRHELAVMWMTTL